MAASAPPQPDKGGTPAAPSAAFVAENQAWLDALFSRLDERQPALQPALAHWRAGDLAAACAELLRYYRAKPAPHRDIVAGWHVSPPRLEPRLTAEALLRDEVTIQGLTAKLRRLPDGGIDWLWRGPADDPEWAWMM
ncbi:MAG TPA: heparinase II/III family protein, partial [Opitutaceae bacterium]|nr:heparinase II/III family protein [Opitutaceae bacterium]